MSDTPAPTSSTPGSGTPGQPVPSSPVTVAITRRVRPEDELLMRAWADAGTQMASHFPGFLGSGWVRPSRQSTDWHMLYRFDSRESLATWQESTERNRWLTAGTNLVEDTRVEHRTGIEGWFDEPTHTDVDDMLSSATAPAPPAPPRWKQMVVIWLAFFPTSVALTYLFAPFTGGWPAWARVMLSTLVATPLMTYLILPRMTKLFHRWLVRGLDD